MMLYGSFCCDVVRLCLCCLCLVRLCLVLLFGHVFVCLFVTYCAMLCELLLLACCMCLCVLFGAYVFFGVVWL